MSHKDYSEYTTPHKKTIINLDTKVYNNGSGKLIREMITTSQNTYVAIVNYNDFTNRWIYREIPSSKQYSKGMPLLRAKESHIEKPLRRHNDVISKTTMKQLGE